MPARTPYDAGKKVPTAMHSHTLCRTRERSTRLRLAWTGITHLRSSPSMLHRKLFSTALAPSVASVTPGITSRIVDE